MITNQLTGCAGHPGNHSFNKRLKALEEAIAKLQIDFSTPTVITDTINTTNANITNKTGTNYLSAESADIKNLKTEIIDNRNGVARLGHVTAESLEVENKNANYDNLSAEQLTSEDAVLTNAQIENANINNLTVTGKIGELNLESLYINSHLALSELNRVLRIAQEFVNVDIQSANRPTWAGQELALKTEAGSPFSLMGIVPDVASLPNISTVQNGDVYFVVSDLNGYPAMYMKIDENWSYVEYPGLEAYRVSSDQDIIDGQLQSQINYNFNHITQIEATQNDMQLDIDNKYNELGDADRVINENISQLQDATETLNDRIDQIETGGIQDVPEDNTAYVRKNKQWEPLSLAGDYVPIENETAGTTINNSNEGLVITSNISMKIPTPESNADDKSALNREYLKNNLKLSATSSESMHDLRYIRMTDERQPMPVLSEYNEAYRQYLAVANDECVAEAGDGWQYALYIIANANVANTAVNQVEVVAFNGKTIQTVHLPTEFYGRALWTYMLGQFAVLDDYAYWYDYYNGKIYSLKSGKFDGFVLDEDGNQEIFKSAIVAGTAFQRMNPVSTKDAILYTLPVGTTAVVIGYDSNNIKSYKKAKTVNLGYTVNDLTTIVASENSFWFLTTNSASTNISKLLPTDNAPASYLITDPITTEAIPNAVQSPHNVLKLSNGDAALVFGTTAYTYILYLNDHSGNTVYTIRSSIKFDSAANTATPLTIKSLFECGNYVYLIPTFYNNKNGTASNCGVGNTQYYKDAVKNYVKIDKSSKVASYGTLPWVIGDYPINSILSDGENLYIFTADAATTNRDQFLMITESGNAETISIGTGTSIPWFNGFTTTGANNVYYRMGTNNPIANLTRSQLPVAVNGQGVILLISPNGNNFCLIKNGEFRTFTFDYIRGTQGYGTYYLTGTYYGWILNYLQYANVVVYGRSTTHKLAYLTSDGITKLNMNNSTTATDDTIMNRKLEGKPYKLIMPAWYLNQPTGITELGAASGTIYLNDGDRTLSSVTVG